MCGFIGIVGDGIDAGKLTAALAQLKHRGPDGEGVWQEDGVSLAHCRLAIIDVSERASQPFRAGGKVLIFNGEIYNYLELRAELQDAGHTFTTSSDTEVLLKSYEHWGDGCVSRFNGMWAFAIWDTAMKTLFISRDRNGQKPLFYAYTKHGFVLSSEMKGIHPFLTNVQTDVEVFKSAYNDPFSYESTEKCLIQGIKRFPAAHNAVFERNELRSACYYDPLQTKIVVPDHYEEQVAQFRELFIDACQLRMRSDVPIGTALSGGVDSGSVISTICHLNEACDLSANSPRAFVANFPNTSHDEEEYARAVVEDTGVESTFLEIDPTLELDSIFHQQYLFEELYYGPTIPFTQLYRCIRDSNVKVSIDGHGADEMFAGYGFDIKVALIDALEDSVKMGSVLEVLNGSFGMNLSALDAKTWAEAQRVETSSGKIGSLSFLNSALYRSTYRNFLPTLLRNYDRYSMMNSVEIRMPFLDHRIQEFAWQIPNESKIRSGLSKSVVRDAMKGILTEKVRLRRSKLGFNSPMESWLQGELKTWISDQLDSADFKEEELYDSTEHKRGIRQLLEKESLTKHEGRAAFKLLMPYIWKKSMANVLTIR